MPGTATIVIDMFNTYDHEDAEPLADQVAHRIDSIAELISRTRDADAELIYVNDNYGDFTATRQNLVDAGLNGKRPELIEPIAPRDDDTFALKVRHSAFYASALDYLLYSHDIKKLVLCGQVTEQCVLYTALDAYIRHYEVRIVPATVAPIHDDLGDAALQMMERNMSAELVSLEDVF